MKNLRKTNTDALIHDVRNALNCISLQAELGKMILDGKDESAEVMAAFTIILQACNICDQLVTTIATESKNEN